MGGKCVINIRALLAKAGQGFKTPDIERNLANKEWEKYTNDLVENGLFQEGVTREMVYTWVKNMKSMRKKTFTHLGVSVQMLRHKS